MSKKKKPSFGKKLKSVGMKLFKIGVNQSRKEFKALIPAGMKFFKKLLLEYKSAIRYERTQKLQKIIRRLRSDIIIKRRSDRINKLNGDLAFNNQVKPDKGSKVNLYQLTIVQGKKLGYKNRKFSKKNIKKNAPRMIR